MRRVGPFYLCIRCGKPILRRLKAFEPSSLVKHAAHTPAAVDRSVSHHDMKTLCHSPVPLPFPRTELIDTYNGFIKDYPIITIEDPFDQDDIENSQKFTAEGLVQVRLSVHGAACIP